jgi:uncharacterized membrane protein
MNMLSCNLQFFYHARLALALAVFPIRADVFWPYFSGAIYLAIGLTKIIEDELPQKHGLDKFGRLFYALPMGVFATQHFTNTKLVASIVPSWMPWHTFWVYLVGIAIIAAVLSILFEIQARLAATLLGCMFLLFVVLMHIHNIVVTHGALLFWVIGLRDLAFSGGAFALAATQLKRTPSEGAPVLVTLCRFFVGIPAIVIGVDHFLHPTLAPGIPMEAITPAWIHGRLFWAYLTGAALIACGACIVANKNVRLAATCLGIVVLLLGVFVYSFMIIANPSDIDGGLNNFVDILALSGTVLVLADAISKRSSHQVSA